MVSSTTAGTSHLRRPTATKASCPPPKTWLSPEFLAMLAWTSMVARCSTCWSRWVSPFGRCSGLGKARLSRSMPRRVVCKAERWPLARRELRFWAPPRAPSVTVLRAIADWRATSRRRTLPEPPGKRSRQAARDPAEKEGSTPSLRSTPEVLELDAAIGKRWQGTRLPRSGPRGATSWPPIRSSATWTTLPSTSYPPHASRSREARPPVLRRAARIHRQGARRCDRQDRHPSRRVPLLRTHGEGHGFALLYAGCGACRDLSGHPSTWASHTATPEWPPVSRRRAATSMRSPRL